MLLPNQSTADSHFLVLGEGGGQGDDEDEDEDGQTDGDPNLFLQRNKKAFQ